MVLKWIFLSMYYTVLGYVYNIEEIEHLKYGIDINSKPILRSEVSLDDIFPYMNYTFYIEK